MEENYTEFRTQRLFPQKTFKDNFRTWASASSSERGAVFALVLQFMVWFAAGGRTPHQAQVRTEVPMLPN